MNFVKKESAFSLSEVLITIGIIGVVAAITIPSLITHYQKKETVTKLKKVYSELNQALKLSEAENDYPPSWNIEEKTKVEVFEQYIMPYMKGITKQEYDSLSLKQISGKPEEDLAVAKHEVTSYTTINGTQIYVSVSASTNPKKLSLFVDINGISKPNQFGKDVFYLNLPIENYERGVYFFGQYSTSECTFPQEPNRDRNILLTGSSCGSQNYGCNKDGRGMWCGALIMTDNWEIRNDYPW